MGRRKARDEIFNIPEMLTTPERDFLLRSNGDKVKVDSLKGKMIGIHLLDVRGLIEFEKLQKQDGVPPMKVAAHLFDAYEEHHSKGDFEVVFVAFMEEKQVKNSRLINIDEEEEAFFNQQFSRMPWLAIPFSDIDARRKLTKAVEPVYLWAFQSCSVFNANGRLLVERADQCLPMYATDLYLSLKEIAEHKRLLPPHDHDDLSLQSLLAAPNRDFLISNQGNKVPISKLKGKVVGLYLYGSKISHSLLPMLKSIYNKLKVNGIKNFEIVFVNLHFMDYGHGDEDSFKKAFGKMPWLALPFKDKTCRKLWFKYNRFSERDDSPEDGVFVVISSNGKSVDPYGAKVIIEYGVEGYPFTREKAAQIEKNILKHIKLLPRIMAYHGYFIQKDRSKVHVAKIGGKNILLFVGSDVVSSTLSFLPELIRWYKEIRNKDDKFEVIYLSRDQDEAVFNLVFQKMPWLAFPFRSEQRPSDMLNDVTEIFSNCCYLIALGRDGRIVTKDAAKHLRSRGADAYPFRDADLLEDVTLDLATRLVWTVTDKKGHEYIPNC